MALSQKFFRPLASHLRLRLGPTACSPACGTSRRRLASSAGDEANSLEKVERGHGGASAVAKAEKGPEFRKTSDGQLAEVKAWGSAGVDLPAVTAQEAKEAFLEATDVKRAMVPPVGLAVAARDDMLKDRFNYVKTNMNPAAQYVVMGSSGAVAPSAVGQNAAGIAGVLVLMGAITGVVYIKTQWKVGSMKEFGDKLREKGEKRKEALESGGAATLVRSISQRGERAVKGNVELIREPSANLGSHLGDAFSGGVIKKKGESPP